MATIGEAARRSGVHIETIRFYERNGTLSPPPRAGNGRRVYDDAAIQRLTFIKRCRELGFSLSDSTTLLSLRDTTDDQCTAVQDIAASHLHAVGQKIHDLKEMEVALKELISECGNGRVECPALQQLFRDT